MSDSPPDDEAKIPPSDDPSSPPREQQQRLRMTPEQRRFLNTPRPASPSPPNESSQRERIEPEPPPPVDPRPDPTPEALEEPEPADEPAEQNISPKREKKTGGAIDVRAQAEAARGFEMRNALLVVSALIFVVFIFFAGRKFDALKYHIMTRINPPDLGHGPLKFPGVAAEELVETGLEAERKGQWQEAADRLLEAKRKNHALPGILFRIGKSAFDRGDLAGADAAFDHSIKFGENVPVSNYYRGLIAVRRHELPAATRYFEAAASAEPFASDFYYFWAEALRLDQHPREAIKRYEQAVHRTPSTQDATLCQFKIRLARLEAVEGDKVRAELEAARQAGPLSVDWLMTDAALQLQGGNIADAARLISEARDKGVTGLFLTCAGDTLFRRAGEAHPEIALLIMPTELPGQ